jgi:flagellar motor switch protein FliG
MSSKYSFIEKTAYVLMQLGDEYSSNVMGKLSPDVVNKLSSKIITMGSIPKQEALLILEEYLQIIQSNQYVQTGGVDKASSILAKAFGTEESKILMNKLMRKINKHELFAFLDNIPSQQIADFISSENPQTIAIILAHLDTQKSAEIMEALSADDAIETSIRLSQLKEVSPSVIKNISLLLENKMELLTSQKVEVGGVRNLSEIFNKMSQTSSQEVLQLIDLFDPELHENILENMFVFDDILKIDPTCIRTLMKTIDDDLLIKGLKNAEEDILDFFLSSMNEENRAIFQENMEFAGKIKAKDMEAAQTEITNTASKLLETEQIYFLEE